MRNIKAILEPRLLPAFDTLDKCRQFLRKVKHNQDIPVLENAGLTNVQFRKDGADLGLVSLQYSADFEDQENICLVLTLGMESHYFSISLMM